MKAFAAIVLAGLFVATPAKERVEFVQDRQVGKDFEWDFVVSGESDTGGMRVTSLTTVAFSAREPEGWKASLTPKAFKMSFGDAEMDQMGWSRRRPSTSTGSASPLR